MNAPIVIFVYNRPDHTSKTLESLAKNVEAKDSELFVYADGAKENASANEVNLVKRTREVCSNFEGVKKVHLIEREKNFGLADNIINGVSEIVNKFEKVIVLEDDLELSPQFLKYMNSSLERYKENEKVFHISGYWFPVNKTETLPETFFLKLGSCWGWGTWKRAWNKLETDPQILKTKIKNIDPLFNNFSFNNHSSYLNQLNQNIDGSLYTWAIKWYSTIFINNGLSLHPNISYVNNFGLDGSGENCGVQSIYNWNSLNLKVSEKKSHVEHSEIAYKSILNYYQEKYPKNNKLKNKMKILLKRIIPFEKRQKIKRVINKLIQYTKLFRFYRLRDKKRFVSGEVKFLGKGLSYIDVTSLYYMIKEIFFVEIYKIKNLAPSPYILDCGANIGLAAIYFGEKFNNPEIVCFEPDKKVFNCLEKNMNTYLRGKNVTLINKGVWSEDTTLEFFSEGADGGRVKVDGDAQNIIKIETTKLSNYITKKVDFLKIDIEGAEYEVLKEIESKLDLVERMFIEYHSFTGQEQSLVEILDILKRNGFHLNINTPGLKSDSPFFKINTSNGMDMQLNIYAQK